jgi:hypothetical protein
MSGPEFSDLKPKLDRGTFEPVKPILPGSVLGVNNGMIHPIIPTNTTFPTTPSVDCFREGETLLVYIFCRFPTATEGSDVYVSGVRMKPWWLRSNVEYRTIGEPSQSGNPIGVMGGAPSLGASPYPSQIDTQTFGGWNIFTQPFDPSAGQFDPANSNNLGNRYVWYPSPKRLDTVPLAWGSSPLNIARPNTSDSILLDDVWYLPLPNPTSSPWNAEPWSIGEGVNYLQNKEFTYPAFGRCLGLSFEFTFAQLSDDAPVETEPTQAPPGGKYPDIRVSYKSGATHAVIQERLG